MESVRKGSVRAKVPNGHPPLEMGLDKSGGFSPAKRFPRHSSRRKGCKWLFAFVPL